MSTIGSNNNSSSSASSVNNVAVQGTTVSAMTFVSRVTGLIRDMVMSFFFGATDAADSFFVAFRIPNFFRRLFAEGAFTQAFLPILAEYRGKTDREFKEFISATFGALLVILVPVLVVGVIFAPALVMVFAPGFWQEEIRYSLTRDMLRITFPYLGFISLTSFAAALLNVHSRYAIPALTPVLLNLVLIGAVLLAADMFASPVFALAWGVLVAGFLQLFFQIPLLHKLGLIVQPTLNYSHPGIKKVRVLVVPAIFAASVTQINSLIDTMLASTLVAGSVSWLYYSDRLFELPVGVLAVALGTVLLPNLARLHTATQARGFSDLLDWGMRVGIVFGVPASAALVLLAPQLITVIFFRGAMEVHDVEMAALSLQAFSVGLLGYVLVKVLAPGYFAMQDTKTPFRFAAIAVIVNVGLNLSLFSWLGHVGLAIATSVAGWMNAILLFRGLVRQKAYIPNPNLIFSLLRVSFGTFVMIVFLMGFNPRLEVWLHWEELTRFGVMACLVGGGFLIYVLSLLIVGERLKSLIVKV